MQENSELRPMNALETLLFAGGGLLMVVGMGLYVFAMRPWWAAVVYLVGSVLFGILQVMQSYTGDNFKIQRLKNMTTLADILFILAGVLMVDTSLQFLRPMFSNGITYFQWVYNKWLVVLLVAVILELYAINRIAHYLKKAKKEQ